MKRGISTLNRGTFRSTEEYCRYLEKTHAQLPQGFRVGTSKLEFIPKEAPHMPAKMNVTLIVPDEPTPLFAGVFTRNAFPGAPVKIGRQRLDEDTLGAVVVNNKISNVGAEGGGVDDAEAVCAAVAQQLGLSSAQVFPSSTGIIGWRIPVDEIIASIPAATASLQSTSILPAAKSIMTTDMWPKVHSEMLPPTTTAGAGPDVATTAGAAGGRVVGIVKGAGMIEPNMATLLSYVLTDLAVPRPLLRSLLSEVVQDTFNCVSVDMDMSTSDTLLLLSSGKVPFDASSPAAVAAFEGALRSVCANLAEDVARNGEGASHLIRVHVKGAPTFQLARGVGKSVVNSPLFKCAVTGNDPNVGRLVSAVGKFLGNPADSGLDTADLSKCSITVGGVVVFRDGEFGLDGEVEEALVQHMRGAMLFDPNGTGSTDGTTSINTPGVSAVPPHYPPHARAVEIEIDLGMGGGDAQATVMGVDLTNEYVRVNADYRS